VVEDDPDVLDNAVEGLSDLRYLCAERIRAFQALDILRGNEPIDLVFSDVVMPGGMSSFRSLPLRIMPAQFLNHFHPWPG